MSHDDEEIRWLTGGCGCGAVRYRVADAFRYGLICHCSQCRAATGAAAKPFLGIELRHFELTKGQDDAQRFGEDDGYDVRCGRYGN